MKRILTFFAVALSSITSIAQTTVKGAVADSLTHEPEIAAIIQFFKAIDQDTPFVYTTTDVDGTFEIRISDNGEYLMVFQNLGRKPLYKAFAINGQSEVNLGTLLAQDDVEMLSEGKVVALKNLIKMDVDKITYKIDEDIDAKSSTLLDMLRKVPMVTVDGQDNITVNGSSSFQVLVDGRPNPIMSSNASQIFKALPATFAKNIEVITNPGVKYDAEGVGGVLNITTNKAANGGQGIVSDGYNASLGMNFTTRGLVERGFVTGQKGKFSFSANFNHMGVSVNGTDTHMVREQLDQNGNVVSSLDCVSKSDSRIPSTTGSISLGYEIDSLRLISASFGLSTFITRNTSDNVISISGAGMDYTFNSLTETRWDTNSITGSLDYQRNFAGKPYDTFTLSYQFSSSPAVTDNKSIFNTNASLYDMTDRYTDGNTNTLQNTLQADYTTKLNESLSFNVGGKLINRLNKSDQTLFLDNRGVWEESSAGSLRYRHDNNIVAGYGEFGYTKSKFSAKAGVRYEHTFQNVKYLLGNGEDFSLDYGNLVPAASMQFNLGQSQNLGLNYNMRISRPGITYLNPYVDISDPTAKSYGNPELETERAHNTNLVYNYFSSKVIISSTIHYSYCGNAINEYGFYDNEGLLNVTYGNNTVNQHAGISTMFMFNIGSKSRLVLNGGATYNDLGSKALDLYNSGWSGNLVANYQQTLLWDVRFSGNVIWATKSLVLDGWSKGLTVLAGGFTKSILDDALTFGLNYVGPLAASTKLDMSSYSEGKDYSIDTVSKVPIGQAVLSVTWNFGNNKTAKVKKTDKTIDKGDFVDRSSEGQQMNSLIAL